MEEALGPDSTHTVKTLPPICGIEPLFLIERQVSYDIIYMWNLIESDEKKNPLIYKTNRLRFLNPTYGYQRGKLAGREN